MPRSTTPTSLTGPGGGGRAELGADLAGDRDVLRALFARRDNPYAGADLSSARRIDTLLWGSSAILALALLPLAPPTDAVGAAGWPVALGFVVAALGAAAWARDDRRRVTFNQLLAVSYGLLVGVGVLVWLAGGHDSPYGYLLILVFGSGVGVHPPRRALVFLLALAAVVCAPLAYHGWSRGLAVDVAAYLLLLVALSMVLIIFVGYVRVQRLGLRSSQERALRLARADALTGLPNRRAFDEALAAEVARTKRAHSPLSVAIVDLDGLKQVNDRFGHLAGDDALRHVARVLHEAVRAADRCFRWGGDEFAVILPDTPAAEAERVCERVATVVGESCATPAGEPLKVSFGTAAVNEEAEGEPDTLELLRAADDALMSLKGKREAQVPD